MDSFYGGKPGISFIIKDRFDSTDAMDTAFKTSSYDKVRYGEYCIIDTKNKNDVDNGKVYRRTAAHTATGNDTDYAEYIGQIVGPAGGIPNIELEGISKLQQEFMNTTSTSGSIYYQTPTQTGSGEEITTTYTYSQTKPTATSALYINTVTAGDNIYKAGSSYENTTPAFKYGFYTFQKDVTDTAATTLPPAVLGIGFEIPYMDFATPVVNITSFTNTAATVTSEQVYQNNPFYQRYIFNIPGSIPGPYFTNIQIMQTKKYMDKQATSTNYHVLYNVADIDYDPGRENTPYRLKTGAEVIPSSSYTSSFVLIGQFTYPHGEWKISEHYFYLGDITSLQHAVSFFKNSDKQYHLYLRFGDLPEEIDENAITPDNISDYYFDAGPIGPQTIGPFAKLLEGEYNADKEAYIEITSEGPGESDGNLGIIASKDVQNVPTTDANNGLIPNAVFFYIWNENQWSYLGQEVQNSDIKYLINTDITDLYTLNAPHPLLLAHTTQPENATAIDDFGLELYDNNINSPTTTWSIPWK